MDENLSLIRLAVALAFMSAASVMDWRTRKVSNRVWMLMGSMGMAILALEIIFVLEPAGGSLSSVYEYSHLLVLVPVGILFFDVFWDREPVYHEGRLNVMPVILYCVAGAFMALMVYLEGLTGATVVMLSIPVMIIVFIMFYYARLIHGGADAKALMALAILFPAYPIIQGLPLIGYPVSAVENIQMTFPFAFLILMNAAILQVLTVPLGMFFKNLARRDFGFPEMFLGYQMDVDEIPKRFVWPMEKIMDGERVMVLFPKRGGDAGAELAELKSRGITRIWITPKVPFIIPMLMGIIFSVIVGNLILLVF